MAYPNVTVNEGPNGSFKTSAAIALYQLVDLVAGSSPDGQALLAVSGTSSRPAGIALRPAASGGQCTIKFLNSAGTQPGIANVAITQGAAVFAGATGGLAASGTVQLGVAVTAGVAGKPFIWMVTTAAA